MCLSEWRESPSSPCLAGEKKLDDSSGLDVVNQVHILYICKITIATG